MTNNPRFAVMLTPALKDKILSMRQRTEYRELSMSEIVRRLIEAGLEAYAEKQEG